MDEKDKERGAKWPLSADFTAVAAEMANMADLEDGTRPRYRWFLLSDQFIGTFIDCIPDICRRVWVLQQHLLINPNPFTPPPSPDVEAEVVVAKLFISISKEKDRETGDDEMGLAKFKDFLKDVVKRLHLRSSHLLTAIIFLERLRSRLSACAPSASGEQTVATTVKCAAQAFVFCLLLANKVCEDRAYDNRTWAHLTKYTVEDINRMERRILCLLEHRLFVGEEEVRTMFAVLDKRYNLGRAASTTGAPHTNGRRGSRAI